MWKYWSFLGVSLVINLSYCNISSYSNLLNLSLLISRISTSFRIVSPGKVLPGTIGYLSILDFTVFNHDFYFSEIIENVKKNVSIFEHNGNVAQWNSEILFINKSFRKTGAWRSLSRWGQLLLAPCACQWVPISALFLVRLCTSAVMATLGEVLAADRWRNRAILAVMSKGKGLVKNLTKALGSI